jgi:hypothetical protein
MGALPIHEAHQHHFALIPQEYKKPPPTVFSLRLARHRLLPYLFIPLATAAQAPNALRFVLLAAATCSVLHRRPDAPLWLPPP